MTDKIVVFSTCASAEEAEKIARRLIESRVAACVNVLSPVRSFYRWKGQIEDASEWQLIIKTSRGRFADLRVELEKIHPYETPEILAIAVVEGAQNYLNWMEAELQ
jgi:periplasmic divalent cation tolerance protein